MFYYLSLGANLGNREQTIREALQQIERQTGPVLRSSSCFYSEAWGFESEHGFCNLCCLVESALTPLSMLHATQEIERALGRTHKSDPLQPDYRDRTIDIDIIRAYDQTGREIIMREPELTLPHPLWEQRDFVRIPLQEIDETILIHR